MNLLKEDGFTLLELLASIVILVIVITSFFTFFTQSARFSKVNEENIVATNFAREMLETVKGSGAYYDGETCYKMNRVRDGLYPCVIISNTLSTSNEQIGQLKRVIVEIREVDSDALVTKAYGYVRDRQ